MCLPLSVTKGFVKFNAIIVILLGLASIITGIVVGVETSGTASVFFESGLAFSKSALCACLYVFGALGIILGAAGYYGQKNKSKCLLLIFDIGVGFAFIAFFVLGVASCTLTSSMGNENNLESCYNGTWSNDYYKANV
jgi:hypothetical protein